MPPSKFKSATGWASLGSPRTQSPSFQPPSYYAAANGIPYPRTPKHDHSPMSAVISEKIPNLTTQYDRFMPVSYIPDPSSSESSFESRPSRKLSGNYSPQRKSSSQRKRQSQIVDLPQIEAQLLPSLRDTIDKMTRPPSRLATPTSILSDEIMSHDACHHDHPHPHHLDICANQSTHPFDFSSNAHESRACDQTTGATLSTPKSYSSNTKPLKSSVSRSPLLKPTCPAPIPHPNQSRTQNASSTHLNTQTSSLRTPTLRSVKSLLTRKLSVNSSTTTTSLENPVSSILKGSPRTPKPNFSYSSSTSKKRSQPTPNLDRPSYPKYLPSESKVECSHYSITSRRPEKSLQSNIPRLRARFATSPNKPRISDSSDSSDSSDFAYRFDREQRERRRLIATNADEPPSSSSDCDSDILRTASSTHPGKRVGLGLNIQTARSPRVQTNEDAPKLKPAIFIHQTPRSSVTSSASSDSQYSTGSEGQPLLLERCVKEEVQRRAALLSLVSTLDRTPQRRTTQSSESSEYYGEQGVAYSTSDELRAENSLKSTRNISWRGAVASPTSIPVADNVPRTPNPSAPNSNRRRSHYIPGPLPLTVPDKVVAQDHSGQRPKEEIGRETARLARQSLMVATREREAFGLKPSDSEIFHQRFENFRRHLQFEKHTSELSASDPMGNRDEAFRGDITDILPSVETMASSSAWQNGTTTTDLPSGTPPRGTIGPKSMGSQERNRANYNFTDIVQQLLSTEELFVANMQTCIRTYVLPLRASGSKAWISGVPVQVSRFLDWFEDILHLHERFLDILQGPLDGLLHQIMKLLPSLEIYQPYIARLEEFIQLLHCSMDDGSDFGHFVNLQDKHIRQSGWTLSKYISEPERRLQQYHELFSAMLESTPRQDPQYLLIFSLLRSTESIIDVLDTVKRDEERHRALSSLLGQFQGKHPITEMADRTRTLLWHGSLVLKLVKRTANLVARSPDLHRTQRLSKAITTWDAHTPISNAELHDSFSSYDSVSSYSSSDGDSVDSSPTCATTSVTVYAAVLSDLVLFGSCSPGTSSPYRLIDGIGKVRVLSVKELGKSSFGRHILALSTPADSSNAFLEVIPMDSLGSTAKRIEGLSVTLPDTIAGVHQPQSHQQDCFPAFRRSANYTTHIWCVPWKSDKVSQGNIAARFLAPLVNSGLPLPRSPSGRLPESNFSQEDDMSTQEREERGWWSFRFHQVMYNKRQMVTDTTL